MNANKNLNFSLLKMKKTGDTIVWLSTIDIVLTDTLPTDSLMAWMV